MQSKSNQHFFEAATKFVDQIKKPAILLEFLNDVIYEYVEFNRHFKDDATELSKSNSIGRIKHLIDVLVIPWLENESGHIQALANSFENLSTDETADGFKETISLIFLSLGQQYLMSIHPYEKHKRDLLILNALVDIAGCLEKVESEEAKAA